MPNETRLFTDPVQARAYFKSGDMVDGLKRAYNPSTQLPGAYKIWGVRVDPATQAALTLLANANPQSGTTNGTISAPWSLDPADTLSVKVDGGGSQIVTFDAARALRPGAAGSFAASASETLVIKVDGGANQTVTFGAGTETNVNEYLNVLNDQLDDIDALNNSGQIDFRSEKYGTGSIVEIVSGSGTILAKIGHSVGVTNGTGDVADIKAVTAAEAKTVIDADVTGATVTINGDNTISIVSDTTGGGSSIEVEAVGVFAIFGFDNNVNSGSAASPSDVIDLVSTDYGTPANQIKVKIETGTTVGKRVTVTQGDVTQTKDNVERKSFDLQYVGAGSAATVTIDSTSLTTTITGGPGGEDLTLLFADYPTLKEMIDFIDTQATYTASLVDVSSGRATSELDAVSLVDIQTAVVTLKSDLQAIIDVLNSGGFTELVTAAYAAAATSRIVPDNIPFTFMTGGTTPLPTSTDWANALVELGKKDVKIIVLISGNAGIHAMGDAHAQSLSDILGKRERIQIAGGELGEYTTDLSNYLDRAVALNSDRTVLIPHGIQDIDDDGNTVDIDPKFVACQVAGMMAGAGIGEPLTFKFFKAVGLERDFSDPEKIQLANGGLMIAEFVETQGFRWVHSKSTWLIDGKFTRVEPSTRMAADETARSVRVGLEARFTGVKQTPTLLAESVSLTDTILSNLAKPGTEIIVGDEDSPPYKNIQSYNIGDALFVSFEASPVVPNNYTLITAHMVPFSGVATA